MDAVTEKLITKLYAGGLDFIDIAKKTGTTLAEVRRFVIGMKHEENNGKDYRGKTLYEQRHSIRRGLTNNG